MGIQLAFDMERYRGQSGVRSLAGRLSWLGCALGGLLGLLQAPPALAGGGCATAPGAAQHFAAGRTSLELKDAILRTEDASGSWLMCTLGGALARRQAPPALAGGGCATAPGTAQHFAAGRTPLELKDAILRVEDASGSMLIEPLCQAISIRVGAPDPGHPLTVPVVYPALARWLREAPTHGSWSFQLATAASATRAQRISVDAADVYVQPDERIYRHLPRSLARLVAGLYATLGFQERDWAGLSSYDRANCGALFVEGQEALAHGMFPDVDREALRRILGTSGVSAIGFGIAGYTLARHWTARDRVSIERDISALQPHRRQLLLQREAARILSGADENGIEERVEPWRGGSQSTFSSPSACAVELFTGAGYERVPLEQIGIYDERDFEHLDNAIRHGLARGKTQEQIERKFIWRKHGIFEARLRPIETELEILGARHQILTEALERRLSPRLILQGLVPFSLAGAGIGAMGLSAYEVSRRDGNTILLKPADAAREATERDEILGRVLRQPMAGFCRSIAHQDHVEAMLERRLHPELSRRR